MRVNVNFTLEIPAQDLGALRELSTADTTIDAGWFVRHEAEESIQGYLADNGVNSRVIQRSGIRVDEGFQLPT